MTPKLTRNRSAPKGDAARKPEHIKATATEADSANNQKRKRQRAVIPVRNINPKTGLKELDTIRAAIAGVRPHKSVRIKHKSPMATLSEGL
jgi:hypothetical protein